MHWRRLRSFARWVTSGIARFLATAGIPLGANTTFIYGDLLIPPLIGIYRKSFPPPEVVWTFVGLFVAGSMLAGALMDALIGGVWGGVTLGSMDLSDRFTLVANALAILALIGVVIAAARGRVPASAHAWESVPSAATGRWCRSSARVPGRLPTSPHCAGASNWA